MSDFHHLSAEPDRRNGGDAISSPRRFRMATPRVAVLMCRDIDKAGARQNKCLHRDRCRYGR
jgi:hypothetical protein